MTNGKVELMANLLISIVIPCFNAEKWIVDGLRSIRAQSYKQVEIIVVDDGSSDSSVATVEAANLGVTVIRLPNRGACAARNIGLKAAKGDFVLFLDADDYLEGPFLEELAALAEDQDLVVGSHIIEEENHERHPRRAWSNVGDINALMSEYLLNFLQTAAFLWRRQFVLDNGGWDEALPIAQDTDLAIRMIAARPRFTVVAEPSGAVIWRAVGGDTRITTRMTDRKRASLLHVLDKNRGAILALDGADLRKGLGHRYYSLARLCYACTDRATGDVALRKAHELGVRTTPGSLQNRIATSLLGLQLKTSVTAAAYRFFSRKPIHQRPHPYNLR